MYKRNAAAADDDDGESLKLIFTHSYSY